MNEKRKAVKSYALNLVGTVFDCYELDDGERVMACEARPVAGESPDEVAAALIDALRDEDSRLFAVMIDANGRDVRAMPIGVVIATLYNAPYDEGDARCRASYGLLHGLALVGLDSLVFDGEGEAPGSIAPEALN